MAWKCPECRGDVGVGPGFGLKEYLRPRTCKSCGKRLYTAEVVADADEAFMEKIRMYSRHKVNKFKRRRKEIEGKKK